MKVFWGLLILLLIVFQYRLWVGENSLAELWVLERKLDQQQQQNSNLVERNDQLRAEVKDLKQGLEAIEERARSELGMIRDNERFYQIIDTPDEQENNDN